MNAKKYKLYKRGEGYKCRVTLQEIIFLFGLNAETINEASDAIKEGATGYYIEL